MKRYLPIFLILFCTTALADGSDMDLVVDLRGQWKFNIGDRQQWSSPTYDDSSWEEIFVPSPWENEGFGGYDGYAWYRKSFRIEKLIKKEHYYLDLGFIDDADEVFFNGELIGATGTFPPHFRTAYNSYRNYFVPAHLIKPGKNVIAVRVYDKTIDGGIIKGRQGLYVKRNQPENALVLEGIWKFKEGDDAWWSEAKYDHSNWSDVLVPGLWGHYKEFNFGQMFGKERTAWYRKTFELPKSLQSTKDLVIVLGKIDDFDEVYLNDHLIGYTNDGRPFGESQSYDQYRIYGLIEKYLNRYGVNTIAVKVVDIGNDAGIYKGPIAIVSEDDFRSLIKNY